MNNIELYTPEQLDKIKELIIDEKCSILDVNQLSHKTDVFDSIIELSKNISTLAEDIDLAIAMDKHPYFQSLTKEEASKEELWSTLNIEYFDKYTQRRWLKINPSSQQLKERVFKSGKSLYNRNSLARLWWITKRTKDIKLDDPYQYTRIILSRTQFDQSILESTIAKNDDLLNKLLSSIVKIENDVHTLTGDDIKAIIKRLNLLGGTYVLDIMDERYFIDVILDVLGIEVNIFNSAYNNDSNLFDNNHN